MGWNWHNKHLCYYFFKTIILIWRVFFPFLNQIRFSNERPWQTDNITIIVGNQLCCWNSISDSTNTWNKSGRSSCVIQRFSPSMRIFAVIWLETTFTSSWTKFSTCSTRTFNKDNSMFRKFNNKWTRVIQSCSSRNKIFRVYLWRIEEERSYLNI